MDRCWPLVPGHNSSQSGPEIHIWLTISADDDGVPVRMPPAFFTPTYGGITKGGAT
jgi:hypothetical protein